MATQNAVIQCECGRRYTISVIEGDAPAQKPKRTRVMSEEERKAAGLRLQTARAAKLGLTLEQYRELHLRPGQKPTAEALSISFLNEEPRDSEAPSRRSHRFLSELSEAKRGSGARRKGALQRRGERTPLVAAIRAPP